MTKVGGAFSAVKERIEVTFANLGQKVFDKFNVAGKLNRVADWLGGSEGQIDKLVSWLERGATALAPMQDAFGALANKATEFFDSMSQGAPKLESLQSSVASFGVELNAIFTTSIELIKSIPDIFAKSMITMLEISGAASGGSGSMLEKMISGFLAIVPGGGSLIAPFVQLHEESRREAKLEIKRIQNNRKRREKDDIFDEMFPWFARKKPGKDAPRINTIPMLDPNLERMALDARKEMREEGTTPYDRYMKQFERINQAKGGLPLTPGFTRGMQAQAQMIDAVDKALGAFGMGMIPGTAEARRQAAVAPGPLGLAAADMLRFQNFQKLQDSVKDRLDVRSHLPRAMMFGSQEAQDTVNKASQKQETVQERVARTLFEANRQREEMKALAKATLEALKDLQGADVIFGDL
jgi:hypothetical protein